jgi:hypothetical protein
LHHDEEGNNQRVSFMGEDDAFQSYGEKLLKKRKLNLNDSLTLS